MLEDFESCLRAVQSRDARFDGWFVTCVRTTGIYCRPSCPAVPPKRRNVRFLPTAAAAQQAGFRACKRCRPDASPGSPEWDARGDLVARAMRLIQERVLDRTDVTGLAAALGYSRRQVERALRAELGAGPAELARALRAQTARQLIETTALPFADVAFAAGFGSVRQFNETVRAVFAVPPRELRARAQRSQAGPGGSISLRLPFRLPFHAAGLFGHLAATAVPGVEEVRADGLRRALRLPHGTGIVTLVQPVEEAAYLSCTIRLADLRDLGSAVARCRRLLDLDSDPVAVDEALAADPALRLAVRAAPGRRIPRTVDEQELAIRAVLGQQVSTASARASSGRIVRAFGTVLARPDGQLTQLFPTAEALAAADPRQLPLPASRARTVVALATALADGRLEVGPGADRDRARAQLAGIPGIGPWTVELVALRGFGDPDAFPVMDAGVRAGAARLGLDRRRLLEHAQRWRPWRGYAVQHLWGGKPRTEGTIR